MAQISARSQPGMQPTTMLPISPTAGAAVSAQMLPMPVVTMPPAGSIGGAAAPPWGMTMSGTIPASMMQSSSSGGPAAAILASRGGAPAAAPMVMQASPTGR